HSQVSKYCPPLRMTPGTEFSPANGAGYPPEQTLEKTVGPSFCACQGFVTTSRWPHVNPKSLKRQAITSGHSGHLGVRQLKDAQDDFPKATTSPTSAESKAPRRIQKHFIHQGHCLNCSFGQGNASK